MFYRGVKHASPSGSFYLAPDSSPSVSIHGDYVYIREYRYIETPIKQNTKLLCRERGGSFCLTKRENADISTVLKD